MIAKKSTQISMDEKIPNCGEAVGDSYLGQIYRFTLTSSNLYTLRRVEKE